MNEFANKYVVVSKSLYGNSSNYIEFNKVSMLCNKYTDINRFTI